jgi:hypothetical protein
LIDSLNLQFFEWTLNHGLCSKVGTSRLETVSTVRGSGWVKRLYS